MTAFNSLLVVVTMLGSAFAKADDKLGTNLTELINGFKCTKEVSLKKESTKITLLFPPAPHGAYCEYMGVRFKDSINLSPEGKPIRTTFERLGRDALVVAADPKIDLSPVYFHETDKVAELLKEFNLDKKKYLALDRLGGTGRVDMDFVVMFLENFELKNIGELPAYTTVLFKDASEDSESKTRTTYSQFELPENKTFKFQEFECSKMYFFNTDDRLMVPASCIVAKKINYKGLELNKGDKTSNFDTVVFKLKNHVHGKKSDVFSVIRMKSHNRKKYLKVGDKFIPTSMDTKEGKEYYFF